jgi:hypothetical protein
MNPRREVGGGRLVTLRVTDQPSVRGSFALSAPTIPSSNGLVDARAVDLVLKDSTASDMIADALASKLGR